MDMNQDSTKHNVAMKYADDIRGDEDIDYNIATESGSGSKGENHHKSSPSGQDLTIDML